MQTLYAHSRPFSRIPVLAALMKSLLATCFTCLALIPVWGKAETSTLEDKRLATLTTPKGITVYAEVADTPAKQSQGLMFRTEMATKRGMLFVFDRLDRWIFWMKNTKMPLDIVWLDANGKVVHLQANVPICTRSDEGCPRYRTLKEAKYVLELGAGAAEQFGIAQDSQLMITLPE